MNDVVNLLTLVVFLTILFLFLFIRSINGTHRKEKESQVYLQTLKDQILGEASTAPAERSDDLSRQIDELFLSKLPILGGSIERFWMNLSLLGWQKSGVLGPHY